MLSTFSQHKASALTLLLSLNRSKTVLVQRQIQIIIGSQEFFVAHNQSRLQRVARDLTICLFTYNRSDLSNTKMVIMFISLVITECYLNTELL
jgi:hypothetical protein